METPINYKYEKYSFKIVSPLMALISIAFLVNGAYIGGSICFVVGVLAVFTYQGVIIDKAAQRYMKYDRFLSFKIG
ncbi:MAG: hypothetical protein KAS29_09395, partial [Bacteroidales bacterium]|nr:hypothetical protein [Bacteroidales bacterium]